jgi:CubicO group peptidase (beta-lactamase class C family)
MNQSINRRHFLGASACALFATGCGGGADAAVSGPDPVTAANVDLALARLDPLAADLMARTGVPGMAVAVVQGDRTVYAKGFGVRDVESQLPVDADTVFQLASLSKSIGATAVAREVGRGHVRWDQPMRELLPWFALSEPQASQLVTVGDLYSHRTGLPEHAGDRLEDMGFGQREVLERLRYLQLDGFRQKYFYTNFGLTAAGIAVAERAGMDWATLNEQAIYQPLGMARTSSRFADFMARDNRASGHRRVDGKWVRNTIRMPDAQAPAASVTSSVNDLAKWLSMLLGQGVAGGRRVVEASALEAVTTPQVQTASAHYGYGFNVGVTRSGRKSFSHSGAFGMGAATAFKAVPSTGLAIVVLTNGYPIGVPESLGEQFFDLVEHGAIQRDWLGVIGPVLTALDAPEGKLVGAARPAAPKPPQPLSAYAGTYRNDYHGPLRVVMSGDALQLVLGPAPLQLPLEHWDGDVFTFKLVNESAPPRTVSMASFAGDRVTLEFYDSDGLGTFVR